MVVKRILEHVDLPAGPLPLAPVRRIDWECEFGIGEPSAGWDGCAANWGIHSGGDDVGIHDPARGPP